MTQDLLSIKVWRVEHKEDGRGPFGNFRKPTLNDMMESSSKRLSKFPLNPHHMTVPHWSIFDKLNSVRFGFDREEELSYWFADLSVELHEAGYIIAEYELEGEVSFIPIEEHVAFDLDEATKVKEFSCLNLTDGSDDPSFL